MVVDHQAKRKLGVADAVAPVRREARVCPKLNARRHQRRQADDAGEPRADGLGARLGLDRRHFVRDEMQEERRPCELEGEDPTVRFSGSMSTATLRVPLSLRLWSL